MPSIHPATGHPPSPPADRTGAEAYVALFDVYGTLHLAPPPAARWHPAGTREARPARRWPAGIAAALLAGAALLTGGGASAETLLNVSYDPTRELYRDYNAAFGRHWEAEGNAPLEIAASHGGSGAQARAVIEGLDAQVVTLALASDVAAIAEKSGKIPADWQEKLPHNSAPYTSTIVFLVRAGNPKGIADWGDLVKDGVEVITPNPKTSGGARWNYLAAWAWADRTFGHDEARIRDYMGQLFAHVPVLDTGARGATTTFAQRGIGDALLAWENEAFLALNELGPDQFEIVVPSVSILAEPTVALVPGNLHSEEQGKAAGEYLEWLYSPEAQAIAAKHYYRVWDTSKADPADVARFPKLDLVSIDDFGGWAKAQPEHFGDGGVFDQIYKPR
ncbi:sulfate ABC transporter substrate-binding protein [Amaricoccus solimangrovi]|uniref:Sulfate ABC transporter substrate-binding protein n=1 Tax=Amaricoccus solimangrovi TaxID=2589815 RepID=A0A501WSP8_9RHOB|nr:sulfate ABC transporter substrate-binding protein [Amaricoccus solimangrovi]TPE51380.1 sulfate ABC transporter substrate-binding protein [Amaricoccus solimangrovi]